MGKKLHAKRVKLAKQQRKLNKKLDRVWDARCKDCEVDTHYIQESYMVHDSLWLSAGMTPNGGRLCVKCLEKRIGRKLNRRDLFLCPLNIEPYFHRERVSKRLMKRLLSF